MFVKVRALSGARDHCDLIGGALMMAIGGFVGVYAGQNYSLGTLTRMGPGYFPTVLGFVLAGLGLLLMISAWFRHGELPRPDWRPMFAVLVAVTAFGFAAKHLGMVPATCLLVIISAIAESRFNWRRTIALCAGLSLIAMGIFAWGLGILIPAFRWSW